MGLGTILTDLSEKIKNALSSFAEFIRSHSRIAILVAAAFLLVILLLLVLSIMSHRQSKAEQESRPVPQGSSGGAAEDFFLPYEPNFVPDILLEKEPRDAWTEEDARPFWTDPMDGNEGVWQKRIEKGIDSLLEHIP